MGCDNMSEIKSNREKSKVYVWVEYIRQIPYSVMVYDSEDLGEIKEEMLKKDASDWEYDPELYETLGFNYRQLVNNGEWVKTEDEGC